MSAPETGSNGGAPSLDPEVLDRLRRGFPLRMDARGAFWFEEDPLEHPGVVAYFKDHLDADDDGDPIIMVDGKYVYVRCDDTPLRITRISDRDGYPHLLVDDGRMVELDPTTLVEESERGMVCTVPARHSGRPLRARFGNASLMDLDRWIVWRDEQAYVVVDGQETPVSTRSE